MEKFIELKKILGFIVIKQYLGQRLECRRAVENEHTPGGTCDAALRAAVREEILGV